MRRASLFASLAVAGLVAVAQAATFCDQYYFWYPNGTRGAGGPDWTNRYFGKGPCTQVSGIGLTQTYVRTVLIIDRTDSTNTYMPFPDFPGALAYAEEVNMNRMDRPQRALNVVTNTFCSSGQHIGEGRFMSIGGDFAAGQYIEGEGAFSIREFEPCTDGSCNFTIPAKLFRHRWYVTTQLLADGRVIIVGGSGQPTGINGWGKNVPSIEYYPRQFNEEDYYVQFLDDTLPFNLYPFTHLLPNGHVFIYAGKKWILWDTKANVVVPGDYPDLDDRINDSPVQHLYPKAATSCMLPLTPENNYTAEIMICGGQPDDGGLNATDLCHKIKPLDPLRQWTNVTMRFSRTLPMSVLLPDGKVFVHGGGLRGGSGIPNGVDNVNLEPDIYDSKTGEFIFGDLGVSYIPRVYHSHMILLHDATVFVAGSNPHQDVVHVEVGDNDYPTEFRTEHYFPPYFRLGVPTPKIIDAPKKVLTGTTFFVHFTALPTMKNVSVVLAQPGFSTHNNNHGMRNVELDVKLLRQHPSIPSRYSVYVEGPPNLNICPPTWYWLFVVADGMPNRDGHAIFVN